MPCSDPGGKHDLEHLRLMHTSIVWRLSFGQINCVVQQISHILVQLFYSAPEIALPKLLFEVWRGTRPFCLLELRSDFLYPSASLLVQGPRLKSLETFSESSGG